MNSTAFLLSIFSVEKDNPGPCGHFAQESKENCLSQPRNNHNRTCQSGGHEKGENRY